MSFDDLPEHWTDLPLREPRLVADVLDLLVSEQARHEGAILFALCDEEGRLLQPCQIDDIDDIPVDERAPGLRTFVGALAELEPDGSLIVARARRGGMSVTADDESWRDAVEAACSGRLALLGVHVVTPDGSRPIPRAAPVG